VGLVERADFASGTSSKSSKLVHGGLRYLEQREFGLVREAATERDLLRRLAPHLVETLPFVLPMARRRMRVKFGAGLWAYDALSSFRSIQLHKHLSPEQTEEMLPALPQDKVSGGFLYADCKTDDVRLVMEILIAAARRGATCANYAPAVDIDGGEAGCAVVVRDEVTGEEHPVHARRAVVAAGVWADRVERLVRRDAPERLRPSKGVHLLFSRADLPVSDAAALIPDVSGERMLFVIPWHHVVLVGTTDTPYSGELARPTVDDEDRSYCLEAINRIFDVELTPEHVVGAYAGLRPLVAGKAGATADLSRRHRVYELGPSVVGITGGKLTTWRRMAADVVDSVASQIGCSARSSTRNIRLGSSDIVRLSLAVTRRAALLGIDDAGVASLVRTYGDRSLNVLDIAREEDSAAPLVEGQPAIEAEAVYCARAEMTVHLEDFLARRTRLALTDRSAGTEGGRAVTILGDELGWSGDRRAAENEAYLDAIGSERGLRTRATR
jgi:glycerol-3-phosphate dehydrogenase